MKRWPLQEIYFWDKAPFFRLLLPLIAGIILYAADNKHIQLVVVTGLVCFSIGVVSAILQKQVPLVKTIHFVSLHLTIASIGWVLCYFNDIRNEKNWYAQTKAEGYVAMLSKDPIEKEKTWKLEINIVGAINSKEGDAQGKAFVYVYKNDLPLLFHEGDTIILPAGWQPIKIAGNPFEFDYPRYCALNNIYHQQFLAADDIVLYGQAKPGDLSFIRRAHKWCMLQLERYITDKPTLGLMQAMLIGDEANLDPDLRQAYSETGIIHIIAISGSHITFFFFIISFLLGWIKHNKWKWLKYLVAIPFVWVYVIMSGAPPSAVRAALMFSVFAIGLAFEKQPNSLNQLLVTAFALLIAEPNWLYAIGFQLSFLAVLSLILFYRPICMLYMPVNKIKRGIWSAIAASIAAEILVAPVVVYYFHLLPLLFVLANVLAYLFMGIVLIAGMCLIAISSIASVAAALATGITWLVHFFNRLVYGMQDLNPQSFRFIQISFVELMVVFIIIIGLSAFMLNRKKAGLFAGLVAGCILLLMLCADEWNTLRQRSLVVYNISKASQIELIEGEYYQVLYSDTLASVKTKNYVLKSAHTGYRAWKFKPYSGSTQLLEIADKSVLILNEPVGFKDSFPVDYVIVNYKPQNINAGEIQHIFNPKQIVLGSNVSRKQTDEWIEACRQQNISLHAVIEKGAFVL